MLILGFDPGVATTGYGLIEKKGKNSFSLVTFGCIKTLAKTSFERRLSLIYHQAKHLLDYYEPDKIVIENVYFAKNAKTAINVGQVKGVILLAISQNRDSQPISRRKIEIKEVAPLQVKMVLTGYGHASKIDVQKTVKKVLKLKNIPKPDDAADALALAIAYGQNCGK
ncbi:MAG: Crossover junction endodeoxyribonuclease RuvC [Parcubacteria group bacterium ADurb.Bin159]|jgi:crossover junction endodeoxyribonuclease RuvC|nr:MAG: Crossover junction endodeoxyribonuclease RuvC [Parcubacteria group bacterium ADurb.Bin159]